MQLRSGYSWDKKRPVSIASAAEAECDGSDYDRGSVETAAATARKTYEFVGKLVQTLHERNILSKEDVLALFPGYEEHV